MDEIRTALGLGMVVLIGGAIVLIGEALRKVEEETAPIRKTIRDIGEIGGHTTSNLKPVVKDVLDGVTKLF